MGRVLFKSQFGTGYCCILPHSSFSQIVPLPPLPGTDPEPVSFLPSSLNWSNQMPPNRRFRQLLAAHKPYICSCTHCCCCTPPWRSSFSAPGGCIGWYVDIPVKPNQTFEGIIFCKSLPHPPDLIGILGSHTHDQRRLPWIDFTCSNPSLHLQCVMDLDHLGKEQAEEEEEASKAGSIKLGR